MKKEIEQKVKRYLDAVSNHMKGLRNFNADWDYEEVLREKPELVEKLGQAIENDENSGGFLVDRIDWDDSGGEYGAGYIFGIKRSELSGTKPWTNEKLEKWNEIWKKTEEPDICHIFYDNIEDKIYDVCPKCELQVTDLETGENVKKTIDCKVVARLYDDWK